MINGCKTPINDVLYKNSELKVETINRFEVYNIWEISKHCYKSETKNVIKQLKYAI